MTNMETSLALTIAAAFIGQESDEWQIDVNYKGVTLSRYFYAYNGDDSDDAVASLNETRRNLGGKWDKITTDYDFSLVKSIGENVTLKLQTSRSAACTPRVVGTETVEVKDYSAVPTKTVERDIVEWDCDPILDTQ